MEEEKDNSEPEDLHKEVSDFLSRFNELAEKLENLDKIKANWSGIQQGAKSRGNEASKLAQKASKELQQQKYSDSALRSIIIGSEIKMYSEILLLTLCRLGKELTEAREEIAQIDRKIEKLMGNL